MSDSETTKTVWKLFMNYDKEEAWLNEMAAAGWQFVRYSGLRYRFEKGAPSEYVYRIQLLPQSPRSKKSQDYLALMEDSGIELVSTWADWVYFRKRAADGPFELFSNLDSMIEHQKRVLGLYALLAACLVAVFGGSNLQGNHWLDGIFVIEAAVVLVLAFGSLRAWARVRALQHRRQITE